jgi:hypothetical protein
MILSLKKRITQRRNVQMVSLLLFLQTNVYPISSEFLVYANKKDILLYANLIIRKIMDKENEDNINTASENERKNSLFEVNLSMDLQSKLEKR